MEVRGKKVIPYKRINHKGSTMVETLVSFVVLFIVLAALYNIVVFSSELYLRSVDTSRLQQKFYREIYKKDDRLDTSFITKTRYIKGFGGKYSDGTNSYEHAALSLTIVNDGNLPDGMEKSEIYLNNIEVTSYVCTEDNNGNAIAPKVVNFKFVKQ